MTKDNEEGIVNLIMALIVSIIVGYGSSWGVGVAAFFLIGGQYGIRKAIKDK